MSAYPEPVNPTPDRSHAAWRGVRATLDLRKVATFLCVAEGLSFRRAASLLYLDQSVVSRHVRALEMELGVPLLTRTTATVSLTGAGALFLKDGHELLVHAQAAVESAREAHPSAISQRAAS